MRFISLYLESPKLSIRVPRGLSACRGHWPEQYYSHFKSDGFKVIRVMIDGDFGFVRLEATSIKTCNCAWQRGIFCNVQMLRVPRVWVGDNVGALGTACIFAVADSAWIKGTVARVMQEITRTLKAFSNEHVVSVTSGAGGTECVLSSLAESLRV